MRHEQGADQGQHAQQALHKSLPKLPNRFVFVLGIKHSV